MNLYHTCCRTVFSSFPPSTQDISIANKSIFRVCARLCIWCFHENLISNPSTWTFVASKKNISNFVELVICFASNFKWAAPQSGLTEHTHTHSRMSKKLLASKCLLFSFLFLIWIKWIKKKRTHTHMLKHTQACLYCGCWEKSGFLLSHCVYWREKIYSNIW